MTSSLIIPITDFRNKAREILENVRKAPVILTQRSHPAAVVVDYETYQKQMEKLEELELMLDDLMLQQAMKTSEGMISLDELFSEK